MSLGGTLPFLDGATLELVDGGLRARGRLAAEDRIYAGHFPGRPILPAIAQLALLQAALAAALGHPLALRGIPVLKLRRALVPGQEVELEIGAEDATGGCQFALRSSGGPVANGALRVAGEPPPPETQGPVVATAACAIGETHLGRLPHGPPACFLLATERSTEGEIVCLGRVPGAHALVREGKAPSYLALEAGAQAAGLLEALGHPTGGRPPSVGYIVGMRDVGLDTALLVADRPFRVLARRVGGAGSLAIYKMAASGPEGPFVTATLSLFLPESPAQGEE